MRGLIPLVRRAALRTPVLARTSPFVGATAMARAPISSKFSQSIVARRLLTTEPPKGTTGQTTEKSDKPKESLLPATGPLSPIGISLFLATAAGIVYYFTVTKERVQQERKQKQHGEQQTVGKPNVGGPFSLTNQDGNPLTNADLQGKFALIYFGFCHCPDICPDELDKIGEALEILDRNPATKDTIQPVFITCDPQRDSPEAIKKYLTEFHPKFIGLTGSVDQVRSACKAFRVYFSKPPKVEEGQDYLVDHSIFSYFMDPDGQFIDVYGKDKSALGMASDIEHRITQFLGTGRTVQK
ncbi:SCO1 protein [Linderina pennispora]|uniref:SCO1 protein n=1 Tax=Linderina pennispora TaxID=61395 RepID=A0A1Y1W9L3_9FUNG|nr:SCO1 protein [Linderina pennispora]ORX70203.1 SCO1 protein [Linderina pennispora]